jgi:hypothetical protein
VITKEPGAVGRGGTASLTAKAGPNLRCTITVSTRSGAANAVGGLAPKQADANGVVSWSWAIGTAFAPGSWPVTVICGEHYARTVVRVT